LGFYRGKRYNKKGEKTNKKRRNGQKKNIGPGATW